jgi:hypothetical protein
VFNFLVDFCGAKEYIVSPDCLHNRLLVIPPNQRNEQHANAIRLIAERSMEDPFEGARVPALLLLETCDPVQQVIVTQEHWTIEWNELETLSCRKPSPYAHWETDRMRLSDPECERLRESIALGEISKYTVLTPQPYEYEKWNRKHSPVHLLLRVAAGSERGP